MKREIGIIGFGDFGQFMAKNLKPFFNISVYDKRNVAPAVKRIGVRFAGLEEVSSKEVVILAIPVQFLEGVIKRIHKLVKPGTLVLDVSSVKVKPVRLMKKYFSNRVQLLGTHPLFGPQSGKNGIAGLNICLCPVRVRNLPAIKNFLSSKLKLKVFIKTPAEHDKEMAKVQALAHFVARALTKAGILRSDLTTVAYSHLLAVRDLLKEDSWELFLTIEKENPFAKNIRQKFLRELKRLERKLG